MLTVNKPALVDDRKSVALACCAQQPKKNSASELCGPILVPLSVGKIRPNAAVELAVLVTADLRCDQLVFRRKVVRRSDERCPYPLVTGDAKIYALPNMR